MVFAEIIIALLLGILVGIFTGLTPGIHINLVSALVVGFSGYLLGITSALSLAVFIISMGVTHTFLDSIPSIFLGAPDADMVMGVLPGHRLLLEGRGYEAVKLTVIGSLLSLIGTLFLVIIMLPFVPVMYNFIRPYLGYIMIIVVIYMIAKEGSISKSLWAVFVFFISGILGIIVLGWPNLSEPLLPMLSGLFGISTLLTSLMQKVKIPKQRITETIKVDFGKKVKAIVAAVLSGSFAGFMPGLGSAQAAIIAMQFAGNIGDYAFLILVGGINTVNFVFSLATFYSMQKARNGAVVAIMEIMNNISFEQLMVFLFVALIAGCIATLLTMYFTRIFSGLIVKVNYRVLCIIIIGFVSLMVAFFSGFTGLLVLITSTAIGIIPPLIGVKRSNAMGCLLLPVILFFIL